MIAGVAIKDQDGKVWSLPSPNRHEDVMRHIEKKTKVSRVIGEQGFVDRSGKFLSRVEAARVALNSGKIRRLQYPPYIFSEELW